MSTDCVWRSFIHSLFVPKSNLGLGLAAQSSPCTPTTQGREKSGVSVKIKLKKYGKALTSGYFRRISEMCLLMKSNKEFSVFKWLLLLFSIRLHSRALDVHSSGFNAEVLPSPRQLHQLRQLPLCQHVTQTSHFVRRINRSCCYQTACFFVFVLFLTCVIDCHCSVDLYVTVCVCMWRYGCRNPFMRASWS